MKKLGDSTDLFFIRYQGEVKKQEGCIAAHIPSNPDYYFGNYLLLENSPTSADLDRLEKQFAEWVGKPPLVKHFTFSWSLEEKETSNVDSFLAKGYKYDECSVLIAEKEQLVKPSKINDQIIVKPFVQEDWDQWYESRLSEREDDQPLNEYHSYLNGLRELYQGMIADGVGNWYGAYLKGKPVGSLGLFFDEKVGRFQDVHTNENCRNQGICRTLVYHVSLLGFERAEKLVMVADEGYHAAKIYESLGFRPQERQGSLCWWSKIED